MKVNLFIGKNSSLLNHVVDSNSSNCLNVYIQSLFVTGFRINDVVVLRIIKQMNIGDKLIYLCFLHFVVKLFTNSLYIINLAYCSGFLPPFFSLFYIRFKCDKTENYISEDDNFILVIFCVFTSLIINCECLYNSAKFPYIQNMISDDVYTTVNQMTTSMKIRPDYLT